MEYLNESDYLNNDGVRNKDNTPQNNYNCGGYALRTFSWYHPYNFYAWEYIEDLIDKDYTRDEIVDEMLEVCWGNMQEDFGNKIRFIDFTDHKRDGNIEEKLLTKVEKNEELIAFRIGLEIDYTCDYEDKPCIEDYDFHYRVYRNGHWCEKIGNGSLDSCDFTEGAWEGYCIYDSPIYYFAMKIA